MQMLHASYQIALAAMSETKETQLKHIAAALDKVYQYKTGDFFIYIILTLDARKPTDEDSIYAKSNYLVSTSIRAYLCIGLVDWLMSNLQQLSIEDEIRFIKLVETFLKDALRKEAKDHIKRVDKIRELEDQMNDLLREYTYFISFFEMFINFN